MSCSRTQHGDPSGARIPDLWIRSPRCVAYGVRVTVTFHLTCVHIILVRFREIAARSVDHMFSFVF